MKIKKIETEFKPVTLRLRIDTYEELCFWRNLASMADYEDERNFLRDVVNQNPVPNITKADSPTIFECLKPLQESLETY